MLKKLPFGESDLIVHFLLEDCRRVSGFAPGARRSKKRFPHQFHFAGIYEIESHREFQDAKLTRLSRCDLVHFEAVLSENIENLSRWMMVLEWIHSDESVHFSFEEIHQVMKSLISATSEPAFFHHFFLQQAKRHGLFPKLDACVICNQAFTSSFQFSFSEGGALHSACGRGVPLNLDTISFMQKSLAAEIFSDFAESALSCADQLDAITLPFLEQQLGRSLKTRRFFEMFNQCGI
ncbi:MAG: DNA repair protein RecO [Deltaproteobacteria bacterium]|nr:DNA repair protein RecO [Deltaproteobacteria bacterium]